MSICEEIFLFVVTLILYMPASFNSQTNIPLTHGDDLPHENTKGPDITLSGENAVPQ